MKMHPVLFFLLWHISIIFVCSLLWSCRSMYSSIISIIIFIMMELVYVTHICIHKMRPLTNNLDIKGKIVVITGGNSGIGFSLAKQVLSSGASVIVLVARNETRLKNCVEELKSLKAPNIKQNIFYISMDLSIDTANVKQKIDELCSSIDGIDVLINCAGFSIPGEFKDLDLDSFSNMMNANYFSAVNMTHLVLPHMLKKSTGQLIFLSSVGGQLGVFGFTAYASSKYAIRGFAEVLYHELRPYDIGVCIVFPPDTETPGFAKENLLKPKVTQIISEQVGLWQCDDVAKVILDGIKKRKFMIGFGSDGYFVNALTCGSSPPSSTKEFWLQCLLMPIIRIYMLFMNTFFTGIIDAEHNRIKVD